MNSNFAFLQAIKARQDLQGVVLGQIPDNTITDAKLASDGIKSSLIFKDQEMVQKFAYLEAATGNSIQIQDTVSAVLADMQILGETLCKKAVFGTATVRVDGVASLPFTAGASLTFAGFATTANNKTVTLSSISGLVMTFPSSSFTAATETVGTITDGTNTVNIAVSAGAQQTLTSLATSFECWLRGKNFIDTAVAKWEQGNTSATVGSAIAKTSSTTVLRISDLTSIRIKAGLTYTISSSTFATYKIGYRITDSGGIVLAQSTTFAVNTSFTAPVNSFYFVPVVTRVDSAALTASEITNVKVMLAIESTASTYMAYIDGVTATITLKDASNNQLSLCGRALTYNAGGSPATWYGRDQIIRKSDNKWYHRKNGEFYADAASRADFWNLISPSVDTELCSADQTALNNVSKSFNGTTNIILFNSLGQVYASAAKNPDILKNLSGTFAARPETGQRFGQTYYATDTGIVYSWTGSAWAALN